MLQLGCSSGRAVCDKHVSTIELLNSYQVKRGLEIELTLTFSRDSVGYDR